MENYDVLLKELLIQEEQLQFDSFTSETALQIGMDLTERARKEGKKIAIDIELNGHQLFHFSCDGTSSDNDAWLRGKARVVNRFGHSSFFIGNTLKQSGKSISDKYMLDPGKFRAHGGGFPIRIRGTGVVGVIAVSGLAQEEDHEMVVEAIRKYLRL